MEEYAEAVVLQVFLEEGRLASSKEVELANNEEVGKAGRCKLCRAGRLRVRTSDQGLVVAINLAPALTAPPLCAPPWCAVSGGYRWIPGPPAGTTLVHVGTSRWQQLSFPSDGVEIVQGGVLDFTGELNRYAIQRATVRDKAAVQKCRDLTDALMGVFLQVKQPAWTGTIWVGGAAACDVE